LYGAKTPQAVHLFHSPSAMSSRWCSGYGTDFLPRFAKPIKIIETLNRVISLALLQLLLSYQDGSNLSVSNHQKSWELGSWELGSWGEKMEEKCIPLFISA